MNYPKSDRKIPSNVISAIEFSGKTGFISRRVWETRFNTGCKTWKIRQLGKLLKKDIFKPYLNIDHNQFYKLGSAGHILSEKLGIGKVQAPLNNQIFHDEWIFETVIALKQAGYVYDWVSEAQLKSGKGLKANEWQIGSKLPDAILKVNVKGAKQSIAIEYERTLKSVWRIKESLRAYAENSLFPLVIFICENEVIRQTYLKTLKSLGDTGLNKKVGLTLVDGWHTLPERQTIQMVERYFSLQEILKII